MRRLLLLFFWLPLAAQAQKPPKPLSFALASHAGYLHIQADKFEMTELSAKPNGNEFGIRAQEKNEKEPIHVLAFLFLWPEIAPMDATKCRDQMLLTESTQALNRTNIGETDYTTRSGIRVALVRYIDTNAQKGFGQVTRAFVAQGDLCADVNFSSSNAPDVKAKALLDTLTFDPSHEPDFFDRFRYATVLFDHQNPQAAAPIYASALADVGKVEEAEKWRRIATDQASMSYGMSGDLAHSRAINEAAILEDPDYPLYYYNLACADAEANDAPAARKHLEQAYARRANTLPGEKFPDPTTDDSILKLKSNKSFWTFVQTLPKS